MKTEEKLHAMQVQDATLLWTMRILGILLAAASIVFMNQDIFTSTLSTWFFGICTGLGVITAISSWLPSPEKAKLIEEPVIQRGPRRIAGR